MRWDPDNTQDDLTILNDGRTLAWRRDSAAAWLGSQTTARLAGGTYSWDFVIEDIGDRQIGVGIMLDPPDWGFFRYLGAGRNAWAYDAPAIQLPAGATVIPAACLLKKGQIVTIANFHRTA